MRLLAQLATHQLLTDPSAQPPLAADPLRTPALRWARNAAAPRYQPRMGSPHPRTIHIPNNTDKAYLLIPNAPSAPFYRLILGNGDYTPTGNLGVYLAKQGAFTLAQPSTISCPTNAYTLHTFDPTQLHGGGTVQPSLALVQLNNTTATAHELGDLLLLAGVDLEPILASLAPTETNYDIIPNAPSAPFYRLILGNGDYTPTGNLGVYLAKQGAFTLAQPSTISCPTNAYTLHTFDPTQLHGGGTVQPSLALVQLNNTTATAHELGDLLLLAGVDLEPILASLAPTETNYDISLFTPLADNALAARTLRTRAYDIDLLLPRTHPAYPFLVRIRDYDRLYLEYNNRYMPDALAELPPPHPPPHPPTQPHKNF